MKIDVILTPEQEKIATVVWQASVADKTTKTTTVVDYIERLFKDEFQTAFNARVNEAVKSWTPAEDPAIASRKAAIVSKLSDVSVEKLATIEAALN